eukprot:GDKK01053318.1.p1 GENE.GDKK01053318.1~~GDKK01053318.1.p1  ORF type:complete len:466 (+),score=116.80 GDKK01053318.1:39-1436(+)
MGNCAPKECQISKEVLAQIPIPLIPDPDFGWRELRYDQRTRSSNPNLPEYGNERTGQVVQAHLLVMALNLAVRIADLAMKFRVYDASFKNDNDPNSIYKVLGVPDMGWRFIDSDYMTTEKGYAHALPIDAVGCRPYPDARYSMRVARMFRDGATYISNAGVLALNVHEAVCRLERGRTPACDSVPRPSTAPRWNSRQSENNPTPSNCVSPTDCFGWVIGPGKKVSGIGNDSQILVEVIPPMNSPYGGKSFWVNPEEMVFNLHTWMEITYNTQPLEGIASLLGATETNERQALVDRVNAEMHLKKQHSLRDSQTSSSVSTHPPPTLSTQYSLSHVNKERRPSISTTTNDSNHNETGNNNNNNNSNNNMALSSFHSNTSTSPLLRSPSLQQQQQQQNNNHQPTGKNKNRDENLLSFEGVNPQHLSSTATSNYYLPHTSQPHASVPFLTTLDAFLQDVPPSNSHQIPK